MYKMGYEQKIDFTISNFVCLCCNRFNIKLHNEDILSFNNQILNLDKVNELQLMTNIKQFK